MGINLGPSTPNNFSLGSTQVNSIYLGNNKVWPAAGSPGTVTLVVNILSLVQPPFTPYRIRPQWKPQSVFGSGTWVDFGPYVLPQLGCNILGTLDIQALGLTTFSLKISREGTNLALGSSTIMPFGSSRTACGTPECTVPSPTFECQVFIGRGMFSSRNNAWANPCGITDMNYWTYNNCNLT